MCELRKRGVAAAVIVSEPFVGLARTQAKVFGVADLPLVVIPHPLGGLGLDAVTARAEIGGPQAVKLAEAMLK